MLIGDLQSVGRHQVSQIAVVVIVSLVPHNHHKTNAIRDALADRTDRHSPSSGMGVLNAIQPQLQEP